MFGNLQGAGKWRKCLVANADGQHGMAGSSQSVMAFEKFCWAYDESDKDNCIVGYYARPIDLTEKEKAEQ